MATVGGYSLNMETTNTNTGNEMSNLTLAADTLHGILTVLDSDGGRWWPSADAQAEIAAASNPEAAAVEMCKTSPDRGELAPGFRSIKGRSRKLRKGEMSNW